jgi:hypothetical protein
MSQITCKHQRYTKSTDYTIWIHAATLTVTVSRLGALEHPLLGAGHAMFRDKTRVMRKYQTNELHTHEP